MKKQLLRRVEALPRKVALPLRHLVDVGQIKPRLLETVLDAGELAGNTQHLLGFAAGIASLEMQKVPASDTIKMAKENGTAIKLDWSPRRWHEEHEKLSRLMTYRKLRADNVNYDVSPFVELLPEKFPGYVVSSRRRLATIAHAQRNCLASYETGIMHGDLAIVCVILDNTRWSVEVRKTGMKAAPLRINQIKTTDNESPTVAEKARIHELLGVRTDVLASENDLRLFFAHLEGLNNLTVCQELAQAGVEQVLYRYDTSPGILPPTPLLIMPDVDISKRSVTLYTNDPETLESLELETGDFNEVPTVTHDLHTWLSGAFETLRNHYQEHWSVSRQLRHYPNRSWDISLEPSASAIKTSLVATRGPGRRKPFEYSWTIPIMDREELQAAHRSRHFY